MNAIIISSLLLFLNFGKDPKSERIVGKWMSENKDIAVEVYKVNDRFAAKVIWFACDPKTPDMESFKDIENPDPKLRNRPWLGMIVVSDLKFNGEDEWNDGNIYDPNTGRTYRSVVRLNSAQELIVIGYWGIELFGKNLKFKKIQL
jgi:uncharacterized protein (DUF2147 family)